MTQPDKPIDTVKVFREAVSYVTPDPADLSKFLEQLTILCDLDCEWTLVPSGQTFRGMDAIRKMFEDGRASTHTRDEFSNAFVSGDKFCAAWTSRGAFTGVSTGPGATSPPICRA